MGAMDLALATSLILQYKYLLLLPVAIIEGPILSMICGFFIRTGELALAPTFIALAVGDLLGDALWYWIGRHYGHSFIRRFGRFFSITEESVATVHRIFDTYHTGILLFSKVTMGLGFPGATLFTAGMTRVPFNKFMILNALGQIVWTAALLAIGYYLGNVYERFDNALGIVSTGAIIAIVMLLLFGFARFVRSQITQRVS